MSPCDATAAAVVMFLRDRAKCLRAHQAFSAADALELSAQGVERGEHRHYARDVAEQAKRELEMATTQEVA